MFVYRKTKKFFFASLFLFLVFLPFYSCIDDKAPVDDPLVEEAFITEISGHSGQLSAIDDSEVWFELYFADATESYKNMTQELNSVGHVTSFKQGLTGYKLQSLGIDAYNGNVTEELLSFDLGEIYIDQGNFYVFYSTKSGALPNHTGQLTKNANPFQSGDVSSVHSYIFLPIKPAVFNGRRHLPFFSKERGTLKFVSARGIILDEVSWGEQVDGNNSKYIMDNFPTVYGKSLVRKIDSGTGLFKKQQDQAHSEELVWERLDYISPALPNDVTCALKDTRRNWLYVFLDEDQDRIPDCSEEDGNTYFGLNLFNAGARKNAKDIFIEFDHTGTNIASKALEQVRQGLKVGLKPYESVGFRMHLDFGSLLGDTPDDYNLFPADTSASAKKSGGSQVPDVGPVDFSLYKGKDSFGEIKRKYFDYRKKNIFHYFLQTEELGGAYKGYAGVAEIDGNDALLAYPMQYITNEMFASKDGASNYKTYYGNHFANYVGTLIAHELGHNMGLYHGSDHGANYEITYPSLMNYLYTYVGMREKEAGESYQQYIQSVLAPFYYKYLIRKKRIKASILEQERLEGTDLIVVSKKDEYEFLTFPSVALPHDTYADIGEDLVVLTTRSEGRYLSFEEIKKVYRFITKEKIPCLH